MQKSNNYSATPHNPPLVHAGVKVTKEAPESNKKEKKEASNPKYVETD